MQTKDKPDFSKLPQYAGVLDYIRKHAGAQAIDIAKATDSELSTTRKRLLRLQAERAIRAERFPKALLFYVNGD